MLHLVEENINIFIYKYHLNIQKILFGKQPVATYNGQACSFPHDVRKSSKYLNKISHGKYILEHMNEEDENINKVSQRYQDKKHTFFTPENYIIISRFELILSRQVHNLSGKKKEMNRSNQKADVTNRRLRCVMALIPNPIIVGCNTRTRQTIIGISDSQSGSLWWCIFELAILVIM